MPGTCHFRSINQEVVTVQPNATTAIESRQIVYEGTRFRVETVRYRVGNRSVEKDIVRHPGAVVILPIVDKDHVCLIRNFRPAVGENLWELPAGTLEPDEEPIVTARRELQEETGYQAATWKLVHQFYMSPGVLDEKMYLFVATDLTEGVPNRQEGEQIANVICPWSEVENLIDRGHIRDAKTLVGLLLYMRNLRSRASTSQ